MSAPAARILPAGDSAVLVEFSESDQALRFARHLAAERPEQVCDFVTTEFTILVIAAAGVGTDGVRALASQLLARAEDACDRPEAPAEEITIGVRYDGQDLDDAARLGGMTRKELVGLHTGITWTCRFIGFAPGFGYLASADYALDIPRRTESRLRVPAGAVALAGSHSAVYPRSSPGGWQIIGTTDTCLWDLGRTPPSLLHAGARIRFVDVDS